MMSRHLSSSDANLTVAQLVEQARHSSGPVAVQVRDADMVVVVLPQRDYEQLRAIHQAEKRLVARPRKTTASLLAETSRALRHYEKKYQMTSPEFYRRFQAGELDENERDYFDWRTLFHAQRRLKKREAHARRQAA